MTENTTEKLRVTTVRPGLVVTLKTSIRGNVNYAKRVTDNRLNDDGTHVTEWETTKTVIDPEEYTRASKVRARARNIISMVCIVTPNLGLLCPKQNEDQLAAAIKAARAIVREFNATTNMTTISVTPLISRIVDNDVEAVKAISGEVADMIGLMQKGIENVDVIAIRKAAANALKLSEMLTPAATEKVNEAVKLAREVARKIVKAGDTAASEIDRTAIEAIGKKRSAFLDLEDGAELAMPVAVNKRAVEMETEGFDPKAGFDPNDPMASDGKKPIGRIRAMSGKDILNKASKRERIVNTPLPGAGEAVAAEMGVADTQAPVSKPKPARARLVDADL